MDGIILKLSGRDKRRLLNTVRKCNDGKLKTRYQIVWNVAEGRSVKQVANTLNVAESTVRRVVGRFASEGEAGLVDRREENGARKLDEEYLGRLYQVVASSPEDFGWRRPTWTRELLVKTMRRETGIRIHVGTMSRALRAIGARRGTPKPTVRSPWSERAKRRRLREIRRLIEQLPEDEVAVYEDEVDIHLNPKIGLDWMVRGQQKQVLTPGKNVKRYLAGAMNANTGELIWAEGERKTSLLFLHLLWALVTHYPQAKKIHVILDNYSIHRTQQVEVSLATEAGQRLHLHFLPPYCPDDNKIERIWQDLHANVTRNHTRRTMPELMTRVRSYMRTRNRQYQQQLAS
jgi:transposase